MPDPDPHELADDLEERINHLQEESDRLGDEVSSAREEWEQRRTDPSVPGAPPPDEPQADQPESPAPQAPPPEEGPSSAEEAPELAVGPPADSEDG